VLQLVVTEWQYERDTQASEGVLTKERQKLVCQNALDSAVDALDVRKYLLVSGSKANIGQKTTSSLFETIVGAIYLDGGYASAQKFILAHGNLNLKKELDNPKGALQEFLQAKGQQPPTYRSEKTGKDNAPVFHCTVSAFGAEARGEGRSKKEAEQTAASRLLWELSHKE
jgi:ribonuclease-3